MFAESMLETSWAQRGAQKLDNANLVRIAGSGARRLADDFADDDSGAARESCSATSNLVGSAAASAAEHSAWTHDTPASEQSCLTTF